jgi:membrane-bound inhibitor of C-type lysozyme
LIPDFLKEDKMQTNSTGIAGVALACVALLGGCGDMKVKVWPFGGDTVRERSRTPADATEYQCAGGKRFYIRALEGGAAVWVILPEREIRLDRLGAAGETRYGNGIAVLEVTGSEATLKDGPTVSFTGCKAGSSQ